MPIEIPVALITGLDALNQEIPFLGDAADWRERAARMRELARLAEKHAERLERAE